MMTLAQVDTKVDELIKDDGPIAYPDANRLINLNIWNQKAVTIILDSQDSSDFADANRNYSTLTADLVANQRDYNFGVGEGVVEIKRVDVSYDGVSSYKSMPLDSSEIAVGLIDDATDIDNYFSTTYPRHDWKYNSIFLYPKPTASVGTLVAEVSKTAKDFTADQYTTGTATLGFDENFHPFVCYGMAFEYFIANGMTEQAAAMSQILSDYEARMRRQYGKKERNYPLRFESEFIDYN